MLLDRIDIDAHGPLHHVELGPFAEHLNVITGPQGSGKTAIARFIRDSLVQRDYPQGMLSASSGRVVWADRNGLVHCRREQDGTVAGRRTVEFESRGAIDRPFDSFAQSWLGNLGESTDSSRAIKTLQLPESIVDGVITDTAATSVARVVSACVRSGLDSPETYQSLPLHDESNYNARDQYLPLDPVARGIPVSPGDNGHDYDHNRRLRGQLAEIEAELTRLHHGDYSTSYRRPSRQSVDRLNQLHDSARRLRARQSELRRWVAEIDRELSHGGHQGSQFDSAEYQNSAAVTDQTLRRRLDDLDAQMIRWRRALSEVRGLRNTVLSDDYRQARPLPDSPIDDASLRRLRLDGFLHAIDRFDRSHDWNDFYPEAYGPVHQLDEIDYRIESATRQIDWLLNRYADPKSVQYSWFQPLPEAGNYYGASSLGDSLRQIREDLHQLRAHAFRGPQYGSHRSVGELDELQRSEQWLVAAIGQLNRHCETLLRSAARNQDSQTEACASAGRYDSHVLHRDRRDSIRQLDGISNELDACLREAAAVRRSMRSLPIINRHWYDDFSYDTVDHRSYGDQTLAVDQRVESLRRRRTEILEQLRAVQRPVVSNSPLSDAASGWLVRLSGGRLRQVAWPYQLFRDNQSSYHRDTYQRTGVTINGREEHDCSAADRALAVIAVRMAAGDLLARTGRRVPLVMETHSEIFDPSNAVPFGTAPLAYHDNGDLNRSNHPIASALRDYTSAGRQVVLLTSNTSLAGQLGRVGARCYQLHSKPIVHAHRPLWESHYEAEQYVGPHPHTYGHRGADEVVNQDRHFYDVAAGSVRYQSATGATPPVVDINRDFDMAWREAYGLYDRQDHRPGVAHTSERTDWSRDGYELRDGYYMANSFTTSQPVAQSCCNDSQSVDQYGQHVCCNQQTVKTIAQPASPFFLTVDSPIDQAPSIDAVAAARLRGLNVTHVNHLMQQDSNRLADALGLSSVDASTIRRWQAECRLVCRVPHLRGFDARVLVGCGVTTPAQLAAIHPVDLLQQVEAFLATDQGQQILLSGSSHELSRITSWIAAANSSGQEGFVYFSNNRTRNRAGVRSRRGHGRFDSPVAADDPNDAFDSARYEYEAGTGSRDRSRFGRRRVLRSTNRRNGSQNSESNRRSGASQGSRSSTSARPGSERGSSGRRSEQSSNASARTSRRSTSRSQRASSGRGKQGSRDLVRYDRQPRQRQSRDYESRDHRSYDRAEREPRAERESAQELKFYLHRESPVADAPSIGARMADRLNALEIYSVDDLLNADAETLASELDHRRVDSDTVLRWQQQATLVCRVPMLRGHDAQLLVAAEVTTPEELAEYEASELFGIIDPIARSSEGKRIIRGGKLPDLAEVTEWISYGNQHRELVAA